MLINRRLSVKIYAFGNAFCLTDWRGSHSSLLSGSRGRSSMEQVDSKQAFLKSNQSLVRIIIRSGFAESVVITRCKHLHNEVMIMYSTLNFH